MFPNQNYNPWFGPPFPIPPTPQAQPSPVQQITDWIRGLEELKKSMKEEKKEDPKKKGSDVSVLSMMLFMLLIAPVTGPAMYHFFQLTIGLMK